MVFSSLIFVFGLLPICIAGAFITRNKVKIQNVFLLVVSLVFYSWGEPKYIYLLLFAILFNWTIAYISSYFSCRTTRKALGIVAIAVDLLILFWFKYSGWCFTEINELL